MMSVVVRLQVIAGAAAILIAQTVVADDWPYYQHDAQHTGDSNAVVNPQALAFAWTAPPPPPSTTGYSTPVIVGNTIYATQEGINGSQTRVSSFDLSTGAINWSYTGNFNVPSQAGVGGGFVTFVGSTLSNSLLYVLDAMTGTLRYTVSIPEGPDSLMPTVVQDPISGNVTAFVADTGQVSAVSLGPVSGSVLWTQFGEFGGQSIPTVVGSSVVLAGPGHYYAFDQATGAMNQFWSGGQHGGGGTTVAYDAARQQFYVLEYYNDPTPQLSAYHYTDNALQRGFRVWATGVHASKAFAIKTGTSCLITSKLPLRTAPTNFFPSGSFPSRTSGTELSTFSARSVSLKLIHCPPMTPPS